MALLRHYWPRLMRYRIFTTKCSLITEYFEIDDDILIIIGAMPPQLCELTDAENARCDYSAPPPWVNLAGSTRRARASAATEVTDRA